MTKNKEAVFFLESQPPHLGELVSILLKLDEYDKMHLCVTGAAKVMPVHKAVAIWAFIFKSYPKEITISSLSTDFMELTELPEIYKNCVVLTTSNKLYVHLTSIRVPVELVPRTLGYHDIFQRVAYRKGRALDYLLGNK